MASYAEILIPRAAWGAAKPKGKTSLYVPGLRGAAIHYTGMDADEQYLHENCYKRVKGIQRFHMETRGWFDIAYSFVVCKHGYIFEGRGWEVRTAAQGTNPGNAEFHAYCFLGDDTEGRDDVTVNGRRALGILVRQGIARGYGNEVKPHSYFHGTACPGNDLKLWITGKGWQNPARFNPRPEDWRFARWYLGIGEYARYGRRDPDHRPKYPRIVPPRGWAAVRWYIRHVLT